MTKRGMWRWEWLQKVALSDCSYVDEWKFTIFLARRTKLRDQNSVFSPLNFWLSFTLPKFYINSMMYSFFSDFILLPLSAVRKLLKSCTSSKVYKILFSLYHFRIQDHCLQFYLVSFDMSYFLIVSLSHINIYLY